MTISEIIFNVLCTLALFAIPALIGKILNADYVKPKTKKAK